MQVLQVVFAFLCLAFASASNEYCWYPSATDCSGDSVCATYTSGECRSDSDAGTSSKFTQKDGKTCIAVYLTADCSGDTSEACYENNKCVVIGSGSYMFKSSSATGIVPMLTVVVASLFVSFSR
uniref:Uncharacterized protein n=1 Tax=Chromera velia CCMP2878 TaxID=1169474 RepID=A0A0G4HID3_9ALVE|eukprot:Cvel_27908.t1-p1 / transcript=Cvel_27908.t1 / gene=Cvel_27908 / organism=Chromera_velia_CCMP2878 / gene_product=hypothetical protein / transcript_product=hypothetical protein / location=Cvel_scaffold3555:11219-11587(-) / protein_length=123 / sequence_SO=supercontig / SO=protein_coding / is_pseudo=false